MNVFLFTSTCNPVHRYHEADDLYSLRWQATWYYCLWIFLLDSGEKFRFITWMINSNKTRRGNFICNIFIFSTKSHALINTHTTNFFLTKLGRKANPHRCREQTEGMASKTSVSIKSLAFCNLFLPVWLSAHAATLVFISLPLLLFIYETKF